MKTTILRTLLLTTTLGLLLAGCKSSQTTTTTTATEFDQDHLIQATLWYQNAAEYIALTNQIYNSAKVSMDEILRTSRFAKPPAVVLDIDETVLNNSPYAGFQVLHNQPFSPATWKEWTDKQDAKPIPGVLDFLQYAASKNVEVFYVSNRKIDERPATINNLKRYGFPNADTSHVFLRTGPSSKSARRDRVLETNSIAMLFGDNLGDIADEFEDKLTPKQRASMVEKHKLAWGKNWIVLPNPGYGSWNSAIMGYQRGLTPAQQDSIRRASLNSFK